MSTAPRYVPHYTIDDYHHWKGDWQLIEGVAVAMSPSPFGRHERIVSRLGYAFASAIQNQNCPCEVYYNLDWIVRDDTVVRADLMVVCGQQPDRHLQRAPEVVVEVLSPSTRELDRSSKRALYREHGVGFYLIVDADKNCIEIIRIVDRAEISSKIVGTDSFPTLELNGGCRLQLNLEQLFR